MFIHHALSELLVCGETEVTASNLRTFADRLKDQLEDSGITGSQKHLQVDNLYHANTIFTTNFYQILECLSAKHDVNFTTARSRTNINKNRYSNKLPSEYDCVL